MGGMGGMHGIYQGRKHGYMGSMGCGYLSADINGGGVAVLCFGLLCSNS